MFAAERVALLLLGVAVVVWACLMLWSKNRTDSLPPVEAEIDSVAASSAVPAPEKSKRSDGEKTGRARKKNIHPAQQNKTTQRKQATPERDHLREPVRED